MVGRSANHNHPRSSDPDSTTDCRCSHDNSSLTFDFLKPHNWQNTCCSLTIIRNSDALSALNDLISEYSITVSTKSRWGSVKS